MKTAFITDQHFGVRSNSPVFFDNYRRFYKEVFMPTVIQEGVKQVVGLGDFWENRPGASWAAKQCAYECFLDPLAELGIPVVKIYGNHDVAYRNTNDINGIDYLAEMYKNVHVIKTRGVINLGDGHKIGLIGWINKENYEESMEWISKVDVKLLAGHFEINDFEMVKGHRATHGFDRSIFERFDHVWSGHFHIRDTIGNITYLANPSQTNWGDVNLKKGFHIFDSETGEMTPRDNPFEMYKEMVWGEEATPEEFRGKFARIIVPEFADVSRAELDLFVNEVTSVAHGLQLVESAKSQDGVNIEADEVVGIWGIIDGFIEDATGAKDNIDSEFLKKYTRELYEDALSKIEVL